MVHAPDAPTRALLVDGFTSALARLDAGALTARALAPMIAAGEIAAPVTIVAVGKAAVAMAAAAASALAAHGLEIGSGLVVTKPGHGDQIELPPALVRRFGAHPLPDDTSMAAGRALVGVVATAPAHGTVLALISGGASALACVPAEGLTLADKRTTSARLMDAGASIGELNTVRKHLSALKGGRLAQVAPAPIVSLVLSDVVGDDLAVVGGGLTVPDPSTFGEAASVCRRRGVWSRLPEAVQRHLAAGAEGGPGAPGETPKPGNAALARARAVRVAGPNPLAAAAAETLGARGFLIERVMTGVSSPVEALAAELAANAVALAFRIAPGERRAIVFGGEPTVALPGASGRGGRAQHVAWQVAVSMAQMPWPGEGAVEVAVLAAGSDGNDGPTADAGGVVDPHSAARARAAGVDPSRALAEFDSGTALAAAGDLVTTGPTGTNLCDLFLIGATRR